MQSKLNKITANKALSQKLLELGVRVDSVFYWSDTRKSSKSYNLNGKGVFVPFSGDAEIEIHLGYEKAKNTSVPYNKSEPISALTSSELVDIIIKLGKEIPSYNPESKEWQYWRRFGIANHLELSDINFANSLAKTVIYLLEQGLVKVEDINKQLN